MMTNLLAENKISWRKDSPLIRPLGFLQSNRVVTYHFNLFWIDPAIVVIRIPAWAISSLYGSVDSDNNAFLKSTTIFEGLFCFLWQAITRFTVILCSMRLLKTWLSIDIISLVLDLNDPQKGPLLTTPSTNDDWVRCLCSNKTYHTLSGFWTCDPALPLCYPAV